MARRTSPRFRGKISRELPLKSWHVQEVGSLSFRLAKAGEDFEDFMCIFCGKTECDLLISMTHEGMHMRKLMGLHSGCAEPWGSLIGMDDGSPVGDVGGGDVGAQVAW